MATTVVSHLSVVRETGSDALFTPISNLPYSHGSFQTLELSILSGDYYQVLFYSTRLICIFRNILHEYCYMKKKKWRLKQSLS